MEETLKVYNHVGAVEILYFSISPKYFEKYTCAGEEKMKDSVSSERPHSPAKKRQTKSGARRK
jgi:hypothetical protein